jgi:LacI family transcriptional regulator
VKQRKHQKKRAKNAAMISPSPSQISQKRIAREAGVSQSTVSLILSGRGVSSDETRDRVLAAAERLRYRPNLLVHGIQTGKTKMIGVMAPPFDFYWAEVLYGIHDVLTAADHVPINIWTAHAGPGPRRRNASGDELAQIHRLLDRRVDGVILWPTFASLFSEHVAEFSSRDLPVVTIDHELPARFRADSVGSDEAAGGRMVAEHLLALGHVRFGHLAGPSRLAWAHGRRESFERALDREPAATCVSIEADLKASTQGLEQAREMLNLPQRPTAIFAATDPLAKTVYHVAAEMGLRIPQDLSVVGFADDDFAAELSPPLTTVRQSGYETGRRAAEIVLGRCMGTITNSKPQRVHVPVELVVRQSTGPVVSNVRS